MKLKAGPSLLNPKFSRYDDYAEIHMHAMMVSSQNQQMTLNSILAGYTMVQHFSLGIGYLWIILKKIYKQYPVTQITIPYWDWGDEKSFPFTEDFMGSDGEKPR